MFGRLFEKGAQVSRYNITKAILNFYIINILPYHAHSINKFDLVSEMEKLYSHSKI